MSLTVQKCRDVTQKGSDANAAVALVNNLALLLANGVVSDGGVGVGTTTSKVRSNATLTYRIDGEFKSKASTDDLWTLSGSVVAAGYVNVYVLYLDASGTASIGEGTAATTAAAVVWPDLPQAKAVVGYVSVTVNSSTFTPGTTLLGAGTITVAYFDGIPPAYLQPIGDAAGTIIRT